MKSVNGYEGLYSVTNDGRVWSHRSSRWLKPGPNDNYPRVSLCFNGVCKTHLVHRLVAEAYIPNPNRFTCVNHVDGNKWNNKKHNLEWCDKQHDCLHAWQTGLRKVTEKMRLTSRRIGRATGRFSDSQVRKMRDLATQGESQSSIGRMFNITRESARDILKGRSYGHIK